MLSRMAALISLPHFYLGDYGFSQYIYSTNFSRSEYLNIIECCFIFSFVDSNYECIGLFCLCSVFIIVSWILPNVYYISLCLILKFVLSMTLTIFSAGSVLPLCSFKICLYFCDCFFPLTLFQVLTPHTLFSLLSHLLCSKFLYFCFVTLVRKEWLQETFFKSCDKIIGIVTIFILPVDLLSGEWVFVYKFCYYVSHNL